MSTKPGGSQRGPLPQLRAGQLAALHEEGAAVQEEHHGLLPWQSRHDTIGTHDFHYTIAK